jgi:hypothetical protein
MIRYILAAMLVASPAFAADHTITLSDSDWNLVFQGLSELQVKTGAQNLIAKIQQQARDEDQKKPQAPSPEPTEK